MTCSVRDKERGKINPSSAICVANAEISAMYGGKNANSVKLTCVINTLDGSGSKNTAAKKFNNIALTVSNLRP